MKVYLVTSFDLGGNGGCSHEGIFATQEAAESWAKQAAQRYGLGVQEWWSTRKTWEDCYEVEEFEVLHTQASDEGKSANRDPALDPHNAPSPYSDEGTP